jgi:3,4-dihydroxy 2-butanone 4-phosphate synthase/GTP cyclohydrolase II
MTLDTERAAAAVEAIGRGEIVVVTDDDDRENEGDLVLAASHATPEKLAFIIRHTSGIVCAPLTKADADRLRLGPMVAENDAPLGTAFTVSVDFRHGLTTGISAEERCNTVRALANGNVAADDFVRPGHVFPLIAREGGVLMRSGHTEAAVDLCRLAGLEPVGVICELVNDDGTVKRGAAVEEFAASHGLKSVSVSEIIAHRQRREQFVKRIAERSIDTVAGKATAITYATPWDPMQHLAIVLGDIGDGLGVPVRIHREHIIDDVFGTSGRLDQMLRQLAELGRGVVIYLREGAVGVPKSSESPRDRLQAEEHHGSAERRAEEWRDIGLGAQILRDLGVRSIRLFAARERRYVGLQGFGIEIEATEPLGG